MMLSIKSGRKSAVDPVDHFTLGPNPIDHYHAYKAAVESSLDINAAIGELVENGMDHGNDVIVRLNGKGLPGGKMELSSVVVQDNGCGMDHATVWERFRGAYHDSGSHHETSQSGRNGVGVKTNFQYWGQIEVVTTTQGFIPTKEEWKCKEENRDAIEKSYRACSGLKPGSPDIESRHYILGLEETRAVTPWETTAPDERGTVVTLREPRGKLIIDVNVLVRRLSHRIEFLDTAKHPSHSLTLYYRTEQNKATNKIIQPFYINDGKDKFVCHLKGNNKQEMHLLVQDMDGSTQPSRTILPKDDVLGDIDVDIKVLAKDSDRQCPNDFVISICGANVYDISSKRLGAVPAAVDFLMSQDHFSSASGFSYRIHGYVRTIDERLKRALRHNKSVLDLEDKYAEAFIRYIVDLLKELNKEYTRSLDRDSNQLTLQVRESITRELNAVLKKRRERSKRKSPTPTGGLGTPASHWVFVCNDCGKTWKVPVGNIPSYCAEFNVAVGEKGCGSRDVQRKTVTKSESSIKGVNVLFVPALGSFIPARYEKETNTVKLAELHPLFLTPLRGTKKQIHEIATGIEQALFAISTAKAEEEERPFTEVYGEHLREWYEHRSDARKLKVVCKKAWADHGITIDEI